MLNETLKTTEEQTTKDLILQLFDTDGDKTISTAEIQNNATLKMLLAGDVDVDGDGKKELSLGVGFTAVDAKIKD
jgi:hypothetical protein